MAKTLRHAIIGRNQDTYTHFACTICRAHLLRKPPQTIRPPLSTPPLLRPTKKHIENVIFIFLAKKFCWQANDSNGRKVSQWCMAGLLPSSQGAEMSTIKNWGAEEDLAAGRKKKKNPERLHPHGINNWSGGSWDWGAKHKKVLSSRRVDNNEKIEKK